MQNTKVALLLHDKVLRQAELIEDFVMYAKLFKAFHQFKDTLDEDIDINDGTPDGRLAQSIFIGAIDEIKLSIGRFNKSVEDGKSALNFPAHGQHDSQFQTDKKITIDKLPEDIENKFIRVLEIDKEKGIIDFTYKEYYDYCMKNKKSFDNFLRTYRSFAKKNKYLPTVVDDDDAKPTPTPTEPKIKTLPPVKNKNLLEWIEDVKKEPVVFRFDDKEYTIKDEAFFLNGEKTTKDFNESMKQLFIKMGGVNEIDSLYKALLEQYEDSYFVPKGMNRYKIDDNQIVKVISEGHYLTIDDSEKEKVILTMKGRLK